MTTQRIAGLDGLRGVAVLLVLVYHLWPEVLPGGFLGVTLFFSLSGFLMVRLLVAEREATGSIRLGTFFGGRARRLLPASLLVLVVVAVVWTRSGWMTEGIQRDLRFSVAQLANWGQLWSGQRYGVGDEPSPVLHFWSLAIEEQTYLVLPLLVLASRTRRTLAVVLAAGLAVSVAATVRAGGDAVVVYYSTFTRVGEILVGGLLALVPWAALGHRRGWRAASGVVAFGGVVTLVVLARTWSVADDVVHRGGLLAVGVLAAVTVAAVAAHSTLGRAFDRGPLAWWGRISYGMYLYHWPLLVGAGALGWATPWTPWAVLVLTIVLAEASWRWLEIPIRRQSGSALVSRPVLASAGVLAVIGCLAVTALAPSAGTVPDFEAASAELRALAAATEPEPPPVAERAAATPAAASRGPAARSAASAVTSYGYVGDSKAMALALGSGRGSLEGWDFGPILTGLGCPLGRGGEIRHHPGDPGRAVADGCDWTGFVATPTPEARPMDVAVVWFGTWDVLDRRVPALGDRWRTMADPDYRDWLLAEWEALVAGLRSAYAPALVVALTLPPVADPGREAEVSAWNELLREFARRTSHPVEVLDVAGWVESSGESGRLLPDGVHLAYGEEGEPNTAAEVHRALVGPSVTQWLAGPVEEVGR